MTNEVTEQAAPTQVQPQSSAIDFDRVEYLRKHMLLTVTSMAILLDVSRPSYYVWLKGGRVSRKNAAAIRKTMRSLATLVTANLWPDETALVSNQAGRLASIKSLLEKLDKDELLSKA